MNIEKIEIRDFKGIDNLTYEPKNRIAVLAGENGTGKTSFIEALECIFGGKHNSKDYIRYGATKAVISVTTGGDVFTRQLAYNDKEHSYMLNGKKTTERDFRGYLAKMAGIPTDDFRVLSSSKVFEAMDSKELSDFLAGHIPEQITFLQLENTLNDAYGGKFNPNSLKMLKKALGDEFSPNDFTALYDGFYKERRTVNRDVKTAAAKVSTKPDSPGKNTKEITEEKEAILKKEAEMNAQKNVMKAYKEGISAYENALANREKLEKAVSDAKCAKPDEKALDDLNGVLAAGQKAIAEMKSTIRLLGDNNALYQRTLDNLDKPVCPISEKLVCRTDKTALKAELTGMLERNGREIQTLQKKIEASEKKLEEIQEKISKTNAEKTRYESYLALEKQLKVFSVPKKPEKPEIKEYDAVKIAEEKAKVSAEYAKAAAYEKYLEDQKAYELLVLKQQCYDALVKATDPKGEVIQTLLSAYFAIFNETCAQIAETVKSPFKVEFVSDNGIHLRCWKDGMARRYENLSDGEKIIVTFIVMNMLDQLTGNKMLFVDNLNDLDMGVLLSFLKMLYKSDYYDHVILCSVNYSDILGALDMIEADYIL